MWQLGAKLDSLWLEQPALAVELRFDTARLHFRADGCEHDVRLRLGPPLVHDGKATLHVAEHDLDLTVSFSPNGRVHSVLANHSNHDLNVERVALEMRVARLGHASGRLSFFRNGYQSWTETRSFQPAERQMVPILPAMTVQQDNPRNLPTGRRGEFTSDMFAVMGNLDEHVYLLLGQTGGFRQFVYLRAALSGSPDASARLEVTHDLGGQLLPSGGRVALDEWVLIADAHANRVQDRYFDETRVERSVLDELPTGWCSWYYYYGKVAESDLDENLAAARGRHVDWRFFVLDDGYETAVGDWLTTNDRFAHDLSPVAKRIRDSGMLPGVWLAPFVARRNSQLFRQHPEWFLKDRAGKPALAGWNPGWGIEGRFYGLDTTHPGFQTQLRQWIGTLVHTYGYRYLKLDFLYGACLDAAAHDPTLCAAERLSLGYRIIREAAGDDVFVLGCGSPLTPARGFADAMRIGPDVAPYWFAKYRYHLTRDPHALCCKFAIRNMLNRAPMHRRLWVNDPDCLLVRDSETRLTPDERLSLANAIIITGGMYIISDRLAKLPEAIWVRMAEAERLVRECDHGRTWALDYMEREIPELVFNSRGYLAVFNFQDHAVHKSARLLPYLQGVLDASASFTDVWRGEPVSAREGTLELGLLAPHASRLLKLNTTQPRA